MTDLDRDVALHDHFALLWRFFGARTDHDVDDLIQQTFMLYFESAGKAGPVRYPKAYILRIARSVLFRHYRRVGPFDPISQTLPDRGTALSSVLARRQRDDRIRAALAQLPYSLYEVLDLYYGEGLRGPVLAAALGIPEGTIRSRLRRAKVRLGEIVHDDVSDRNAPPSSLRRG